MRYLIFLLSLGVAMPNANAASGVSSVVAADQELWNAVNDINLRIATRRYGTSGVNALALASVGGIATYLGRGALKTVKSQPAGVLLAISAGTVTSLVFTAGAAWWAGVGLTAATLNDFNRFKPGQRAFWRVELDSHVQATLDQVKHITTLPVPDQYRLAAADPNLRQFLIQFDEWLRDGVGHNAAPPVAPVGSFELR